MHKEILSAVDEFTASSYDDYSAKSDCTRHYTRADDIAQMLDTVASIVQDFIDTGYYIYYFYRIHPNMSQA